MLLIGFFTFLLVCGILFGQIIDLTQWRNLLSTFTIICLAYIMIEVGLEFSINKAKWKDYLKDFSVAMSAAIFPVILCVVYFIYILKLTFKDSVLVGMSTAPTSAGVLFTMLLAAGLGASWVFKKARVLAIFDDLGTILLMVFIKIWLTGFSSILFWTICILIVMGMAAVHWQKQLKLPISKGWVFGYAIILTMITAVVEYSMHIHLEILFPAFVLGSILFHPAHEARIKHGDDHNSHDHHNEGAGSILFDQIVKGIFMFLVGCSLPKISLEGLDWLSMSGHIAALLVLSNLGKCFPIIAYRKERSFKERLALSIAMFPRGEVGAGVLLIALGYGVGAYAVGIAVLTLALNVLLTGVFIIFIKKLISLPKTSKKTV